MATVNVDRNIFGLVVVVPAGHPVAALLNRLPHDQCLRPLARSGEYIVALTAEVLPLMRKLYKMEEVKFTLAAVEALKHLSDTQRAMKVAAASVQRPRVDISTKSTPNLQGLPATLDPISAGGIGQPSPGKMIALSSNEESPPKDERAASS